MSGSFTLSIPNLSILNIGGSRRAEAAEIAEMVERSLAVFLSNHSTSVSFKDRNGATAGTISWTPVNSS